MKLCIGEVRKQKGFSQEELAGKVGLSQEVISRYETGEYKIRLVTLCHIADALAVPVTMLFLHTEDTPHELVSP